MVGRLWREFVAPGGKKYYFNTKTKETTWIKPETDESTRKVVQNKAVFVFELLNNWNLVLTDNGDKFYYSNEDQTSFTDVADTDEQCLQLMNAVGKDKLVLLLGVSRGYSYPQYRDVYNEVVEELDLLKKDIVFENTEQPDADVSSSDNDSETAINHDNDHEAMVTGYGSSSDEEEDEEVEEEVPDVSNEVASPTELTGDSEINKQQFTKLFSKYSIDALSSWRMAMKKLRNDPDYYLISDPTLKEELFEAWCAAQLSNDGEQFEVDDPELASSRNDEVDELIPLKYHYLAHILSKTTITDTTIFMDVKKQNKNLFKQFKIKQFVKSKKELETFVSKLLFYYKTLTLEQRRQVFTNLLVENEKEIHQNLKPFRHEIHLLIQSEPSDSMELETQLLKIEKFCKFHDSLGTISNDHTYYVLGIKDKLLAIKVFLKRMLH